MKKLIAGMAIVSLGFSAHADLEGSEEAGTFGKWTVSRSIEKKSERVVCVGIHETNYDTQLGSDSLYIGVEGGIREITVRFGENKPESTRKPTLIEKMMDTVIIEEADFRRALASNRLRVKVKTKLQGIHEFEYDMQRSIEAVQHMKNGCPLP